MDKFFSIIKKTKNCWTWVGPKMNGYGFYRDKNQRLYAHRVSYFYYIGELDKSLVVDHICNNRECVNPKHLQQITSVENTMRGNGPAAINKRKKNCQKGHPLSGKNLLIAGKRKGRVCRICKRQREKDSYWREKNIRQKNLMDKKRITG